MTWHGASQALLLASQSNQNVGFRERAVSRQRNDFVQWPNVGPDIVEEPFGEANHTVVRIRRVGREAVEVIRST